MLLGNVLRIDRSIQMVEVQPVAHRYPVRVPYPDASRAPAPLSTVALEQRAAGAWTVAQPGVGSVIVEVRETPTFDAL